MYTSPQHRMFYSKLAKLLNLIKKKILLKSNNLKKASHLVQGDALRNNFAPKPFIEK